MKDNIIKGRIHSKESFGTVDGPGIRYVLFMQGCPMRCLYCHNPDTWKIGYGEEVTAEEILAEYEKNRSFYKKGGITVTGGEPLLQTEFVAELFYEAKKRGIHTCLDTSGVTFSKTNAEYTKKLDRLLKYTDLVMLDIKHIDPEKHEKLTGYSNENILAFAKYLEEKKLSLWIRHVVVPGYTDDEESLFELGKFIGKLKNLRALDVLPYHNLGESKYEELNIPYPLKGTQPLSAIEASKAKTKILEGIFAVREK